MKRNAKHAEKSAHHRHGKDEKSQKFLMVIVFAFLGIALYDLYIVYSSNAIVNEKIAVSAEAARPANLEVTRIIAQGCSDCYDLTQVENAIGQLNVNVSGKVLSYTSDEAKQLISKYSIKKIPTMLITGEIGKAQIGFWSQVGTIESDDTLVLRYGAPYIDPSTGMEIGKAKLVEIADKSCSSCYNVSVHESVLKGFGLVFSNISAYDSSSQEGARLISLYNITKVPTMLISPDAKYYESLQGIWKEVGTIEKDGWYVFRSMQALGDVSYKDLSLNRVVNSTAAQ